MRKPNPPGQVRVSRPAANGVTALRRIPFVTCYRPQDRAVRPEGRGFKAWHRSLSICRARLK
jgi:hypothetical protein